MSERPQATPTVQAETGRVKVTRWDFPPGGETGWHVHEYDYVVVPVLEGVLKLENPDGGVVDFPLVPGHSYAREKGVHHNVVNGSDHPVAFVEIELL